MSQTDPLYPLIREVSRNAKPASDAERLVIIDVASKRSVEKKRAFREAKYFIVSNTLNGGSGVESQTPPIRFKDFETDQSVSIQVSYLAACQPGREQRVAEALFDGPHPAAVLNEKIKRWLGEYASFRQSEFIAKFFELQQQIQSHIKSRANEELGLSLSVKLRLQGATEPDTIAIGPMNFPVRLKDCDDTQDLSVKGELSIHEQSKINSILHRSDKAALEMLVKKEIQSYFAEAVSLNDFFNGLHVGGIKQRVINHLDAALRHLGRKIGYISLANDVKKDDVKPFFETDINIECKIKEYPKLVVIKNTVQMILQDVAKYRANKSPGLLRWIEEKLPPVIRELLLDKNCADLLLTFTQLEKIIKEMLNSEAEAIGYSIKQLITVPALEALEWLEPFTMEAQGDFETRVPKFNVSLEIAVTARIKDLRGVQYYVNRGQNVPGLMEKAIIEKAKEYLHTIEPESFYIHFSSPKNEGQKTVEQELIDRITDTLVKHYNAEVISVTPKMGDTAITEKLRLLQMEVCPFNMEIFLADSEAIVPVRFIGVFKVESVDANGWHKFQQLEYDIKEIKQYIETNVAAELDECMKEGKSSQYEVNSYEQLIKKLAQEAIKNVYGLAIAVYSVRRLHNELESAEREVRKQVFAGVNEADKLRVESLIAELITAETVLLTLIGEDGSETQIKEQKKKIALIRRELPQGYASSGGKFKQLSASIISGRDSLLSSNESKRLASGAQSQEGAGDGE